MPITFSPAQPYDPNVAIAYGALQQFEQNQEAERKNYQAVQDAEAKQRASMLEAANLQQRGQHFQQGLQQQTQMEQMREQAQTNNINLSGAWQAQNQEAERKARYTYADEIRRQRINQGIATIDSELASGMITPESYNQLLGHAMNNVDILEMRRDQAQQQEMESRNKREAQQSAMAATRIDAERRFYARSGPNTQARPDGSEWAETQPGHWTLTRPPRSGPGAPIVHRDEASGREFFWNGTAMVPLDPVRTGGASGPGGSGGARAFNWDSTMSDIRGEKDADGNPRFADEAAQRAEAERRHLDHIRGINTQQLNAPRAIGGPLPFPGRTPPEQINEVMAGPANPGNLSARINILIERDMRDGDRERELAMRELAHEMRRGTPTGALVARNPEYAAALQRIGYYHHEFTPYVDQVIQEADNAWKTNESAARLPVGIEDGGADMRRLLQTYGSRELMPEAVRERFDRVREAMGLRQWPPPAQALVGQEQVNNQLPVNAAPDLSQTPQLRPEIPFSGPINAAAQIIGSPFDREGNLRVPPWLPGGAALQEAWKAFKPGA